MSKVCVSGVAGVSGVSDVSGDSSSIVLPLVLITPALFAANMLVARWAESAAIPPWFLAFGRWSAALMLLLPWAAPQFRRWKPVLRAHWGRMLVLSVFGMGLAVGPQYVGARSTEAVNIALIFSACPMLVGVIETLGWGAPFSRIRALGMALSMAGVLVVLARGDISALLGLKCGAGDAWVLFAAIGWAIYTVLGKRLLLPSMPVSVKLACLAFGGALVLAPLALMESSAGMTPDFTDMRLYLALAVLAVVPSLGAYIFYDRLVSVVGAVGASVSMYMVPLYASLDAWPLLGEVPRLYHALGFALILLGVVVTGRHTRAM